ncbi:unnamed protein product [Brachionus calyciflorus]|uniref:TROVE domain-containing protein n=1 Tax=Brachionus calyciflorus TaxID=104777 RepID=A0A813LXV3_9BILA|nr:unnamed protein product [Brachionus calyciflorus]
MPNYKKKYNLKKNFKKRPKRRTFKRCAKITNVEKTEKNLEKLDLDINRDSNEFFTKNATYDQHYDAQVLNREKYLATIIAFKDYSIEILPNAKARTLAAAFARHDTELIDYLLEENKQFGFSDVLKAITILDSQREKRSIEKKIERIQKTGAVIKPKKMAEFKKNLNNLELLRPKNGSFSGAMANKLRKWVRKFDAKELEFFAICLPTDPWKKLANICHLNPSKDFPNAPWFLPFCYGNKLPEDSKVERCRNMTADNVNELIKEFDLPFRMVSHLKKYLNAESKKCLAEKQEKLDSILWYYEDLNCPEVDDIIKARLEKGEKVELGYGKLMERLLLFKSYRQIVTESKISILSLLIPIAEKNLKNFRSTVASPVAVLGDASSSMNVAIRTATIISSLLATICDAKLTFFNYENFASESEPKNISDVLDVAFKTEASGSTAPAASLVPYFNKKEIIKTFIIVTDEEENTYASTSDGKTWRFFELFMEYRKTIYPASLIFVSFLGHQHSQGQMYSDFVRENVPDVLQFKFSRSRPDLTKLDSILGTICSRSSQSFSGHVEKIESNLRTNGLSKYFENMTIQKQ